MRRCYYDMYRECREGDCCLPHPDDGMPGTYPSQEPRWKRTMTDRDECPKAFYCLPESCGDCPHDEQQDEQVMDYKQAALVLRKFMCYPAGQEFVEERLIRPFRMDDEYRAEGERAATERIVKWLRSDRWVGFRSTCMSLADAIERGEHE